MDPVTQGLIGATAARVSSRQSLPHATWIGLLAGMAPDLDILIRSESDPLIAVEYHRHFTHALAFIPIGGILCALPWLLFPKLRKRWKEVLLASTAAVATHGLLDASTTYGTQLLWPFTDFRAAWDWISIIDPVFTGTLLLGIILSAARKSRIPAIISFLLCLGYIGLGAIQNQRALSAQEQIAEVRGHQIERGAAFPTIGNLLVWRSLYQYEGNLYSDRIRVSLGGKVNWAEGVRVQRMTVEMLPERWRSDPIAVEDFHRFAWFSDQWVATSSKLPALYGDARYSLNTAEYDPIWGIRFEEKEGRPTNWVSRTTERELELADLWAEIQGTDPEYQELP